LNLSAPIFLLYPFFIAPDTAQWLAFAFNLVYLFLAVRGSAWCWLWGFFGTGFQLFVCLDANLKSDAFLQIYYLFSATYGFWTWQSAHQSQPDIFKVETRPLSTHLKILGFGMLLVFPLGYMWQTAAWRYPDALLTIFSIFTTFLTAKKILEAWLYWFIIDTAYIYIYYSQEKELLALLSLVYAVFSILGFRTWRLKMKVVENTPAS
jgi:nicotinamide mononucleotide transporter